MAAKGTLFQVDTSPSKEVVVLGLTKDASVQACIFDLIDNAVDAAGNTLLKAPKKPTAEGLPQSYAGYWIKLSLSGSAFKIEDNCGGIATADLKTMVLRFGKRSSHDTGIGVFGVGLNRALFKLGRISHIKTDTGKERSELVLNTEDYIRDDNNWNLPAEGFPSQGEIGTQIEISQIPEDIAQQFAGKDWVDEIRHEIGQRYGRFLAKKLSILVNKKSATNEEVPLREDGPYEGEHKFYKTDNGVSIFIQYGQHLDHRFKNEVGYDIETNKDLTQQYGWTVLCNDRAIVIADTSDKTGWDTKFHSEFYGFVGRVSFVCSDPSKLPWNTTKTDVDLNNHAYRTALKDMRAFAENWRTTAGKRKKQPAPKSIPPKKKTAEPKKTGAATTRPAPTKASKPVVKQDHHQFREVLPPDVQETHCSDKHLAIVHEAKTLDLGDFPYAGMAFIRILFEISVAKHLHRHGKFDELKKHSIDTRRKNGQTISTTDEKNIFPKMDEILPYLDNHPEVWGAKQQALKHSLKRMIAHGPLLNSAVHNPFQIIDRSKAFEIRNEVLPVIRHLIET
jgi:hypothetical protein